ncbi:SAM-dependent DNA methyltransferase [Segetibacter aerophilus]|uniref:SAM-dependent DNA methyltransferase n=1 Tax=Segetibacter aerophilus TaxID=670293 RepID=UPI0015828620|nr:SAM-dependent DNA methyltransferase [Segetibacter aerophilus]
MSSLCLAAYDLLLTVPNNLPFASQVGETVGKKLLKTTDAHTILRLPTSIFYANGGKSKRYLLRQQAQQQRRVDKRDLVLQLPH